MFSAYQPPAPEEYYGLCFTSTEDCDYFLNIITMCLNYLKTGRTDIINLEEEPTDVHASSNLQNSQQQPQEQEQEQPPQIAVRKPTMQLPKSITAALQAVKPPSQSVPSQSSFSQAPTFSPLPSLQLPAQAPTAPADNINLKVLGIEKRIIRRASGMTGLLRSDAQQSVINMEFIDGDKTLKLCKTQDELVEIQQKIALVSPEISGELIRLLADLSEERLQRFLMNIIKRQLHNTPPYSELFKAEVQETTCPKLNPVKSGFLSVKLESKKPMWCVLAMRQLFLYTAQGIVNPVVVISLDGAELTAITKTKKKSKSQGMAFVIKTPKADYPFTTSTTIECDEWMAAIRLVQAEAKECSVLGQLKVRVLEGKNLVSRDLNGYSDPFAYLITSGQQIKTTTVYKSLNPKWNDPEHTFDVTNGAAWLHILLWDEDRFKASDFMGKVDIPLSSIDNGAVVCKWFALAPQKTKDKITGELLIQLSYSYREVAGGSMAASGGSTTTKVFKVPLEAVLQRERTTIPTIVTKAIEYIRARAMREEGIFRLSGALHSIQDYKTKIDSGMEIDFNNERDPHVVSGLLKLYFRELPEPLLTFDLFDAFLATAKLEGAHAAKALSDLVAKLPPPNYAILRYLITFLYELSQYEAATKMNRQNLAIVFGPQLLRQKVETLDTVMLSVDINQVVTSMLEFTTTIFKN